MHVTTPTTREVTVVPPELGLDVAYRIMQRKRIRHLPVAAGGELLGMLSDRDVLTHARLSDDGALIVPAISCGVAMTPSPATCDADATVDQVVRVMTERKICRAPSRRAVGAARRVGHFDRPVAAPAQSARGPAAALPVRARGAPGRAARRGLSRGCAAGGRRRFAVDRGRLGRHRQRWGGGSQRSGPRDRVHALRVRPGRERLGPSPSGRARRPAPLREGRRLALHRRSPDVARQPLDSPPHEQDARPSGRRR
ncbi:MAG: CBS domain-containing protein [Polyangiaceae bacterium]|nr:CBS domain-containing protein [Polyangiaceae bacterium]